MPDRCLNVGPTSAGVHPGSPLSTLDITTLDITTLDTTETSTAAASDRTIRSRPMHDPQYQELLPHVRRH